MAATFVIEDGTGKSNANAYCSVAEADQYHENHGNPTTWTDLNQAQKEQAIRTATQYMDLLYNWKWRRTNDEQALDWPRSYVVDEDGFALAADEIPVKIKDACAYLALKSVSDTLIPDQVDESAVKRIKQVVGPLTKEVEYAGSERPTKTYTIADRLVAEFIYGGSYGVVELVRA